MKQWCLGSSHDGLHLSRYAPLDDLTKTFISLTQLQLAAAMVETRRKTRRLSTSRLPDSVDSSRTTLPGQVVEGCGSESMSHKLPSPYVLTPVIRTKKIGGQLGCQLYIHAPHRRSRWGNRTEGNREASRDLEFLHNDAFRHFARSSSISTRTSPSL